MNIELTFSLTCKVEHWRSDPKSLCGFQVTELALKTSVFKLEDNIAKIDQHIV